MTPEDPRLEALETIARSLIAFGRSTGDPELDAMLRRELSFGRKLRTPEVIAALERYLDKTGTLGNVPPDKITDDDRRTTDAARTEFPRDNGSAARPSGEIGDNDDAAMPSGEIGQDANLDMSLPLEEVPVDEMNSDGSLRSPSDTRQDMDFGLRTGSDDELAVMQESSERTGSDEELAVMLNETQQAGEAGSGPSRQSRSRNRGRNPRWGPFLGGVGGGIERIGHATGSKPLQVLGGVVHGAGQIYGAMENFGLFGEENEGGLNRLFPQMGGSENEGGSIEQMVNQAGGESANLPPLPGQEQRETGGQSDLGDLAREIVRLRESMDRLADRIGGGRPGLDQETGEFRPSMGGNGDDLTKTVREMIDVVKIVMTMARMAATLIP